jgi:hypothetical protein
MNIRTIYGKERKRAGAEWKIERKIERMISEKRIFAEEKQKKLFFLT